MIVMLSLTLYIFSFVFWGKKAGLDAMGLRVLVCKKEGGLGGWIFFLIFLPCFRNL